MIEFDPHRDKLVSPLLAPREAGMRPKEFAAYRRPDSPLPVFRFPSVAPQGVAIECYLAADLRRLRGGVML